MLHWVLTLGGAVLSCPGSPAVSVVVIGGCLPVCDLPLSRSTARLCWQHRLSCGCCGQVLGLAIPLSRCLHLLPGELFSRLSLSDQSVALVIVVCCVTHDWAHTPCQCADAVLCVKTLLSFGVVALQLVHLQLLLGGERCISMPWHGASGCCQL